MSIEESACYKQVKTNCLKNVLDDSKIVSKCSSWYVLLGLCAFKYLLRTFGFWIKVVILYGFAFLVLSALLSAESFGLLSQLKTIIDPAYHMLMYIVYYSASLAILSGWMILFYHIQKHKNMKKYYKREIKKNDLQEYIKETIKELDFSMLRYNTIGMGMILLVIFLSGILGVMIFLQFSDVIEQVGDIIDSNPHLTGMHTTLLLFIYVLRTSLIGAFIIAVVIYSFRFANAAFDQATRFNKRKHATLFLLNFMQGEDSKSIEETMQAFREWNVSIESAFSVKHALQEGNHDTYLKEVLAAIASKKEKE